MAKGRKVGTMMDGKKKLNIMKTKGKGSKTDLYYVKPVGTKRKKKK